MKIYPTNLKKIALLTVIALFVAAPAWADVSISVSPDVPSPSDDVIITVSESGTFPNSCLPFELNAEFGSGVIDVEPVYNPEQLCTQALTENQYTLSVNVGMLAAGDYTIKFFSSTAGLVEKQFSVEAFNNEYAGCATYDFFNGILRIPDLTLGDLSYWLDFQIVGINPLVFVLVDIGDGESTEQSATLDFDTGVIFVPCLNVGDSYFSEWQILPGSASGTRIELIGYGYNDLFLGENP